jgi:hypothetical protein
MPATVLSGASGAFAYKPASTSGTFAPANVVFASAEITIETYRNFKVGDPVKFAIYNPQGGAVTGTNTLPAGLTAGTVYYVFSYVPATGVLKVSATLGGTSVTLTTAGTAASPNEFRVDYADYALVAQVRDWTFEITRSEIDVTTIGQTPGQYAPFKNYITGFADGTGSATVYMTDEDSAFANRMIEDVLQRNQVGASVRLYVDRVVSSGTTTDETKSRSIAMDVVLTSASMNVNPDDAISVSINFRPAGAPTIDLSQV